MASFETGVQNHGADLSCLERQNRTREKDPFAHIASGAVTSEEFKQSTLAGYVRYGYLENGNFRQSGLVPIGRRIPEDAITISPAIYLLTAEQEQALANGKRWKELQGECERAGRIMYAVLAESDALEKNYELSTVANWMSRFAEEWLELDVEDYSLFFSGNRSVHLHTTKFVPGEEGRQWLQQQAETYNEETEAELDTSIYDPKSQFRLTGVEHEKTNLKKVEISREDTRKNAVRVARTNEEERNLPFHPPRDDRISCYSSRQPLAHYSAGDESRNSLPDEFEGRLLQEYIKANPGTTESGSSMEPIFSPYANTGDGQRSVCLLHQNGEIVQKDGTHYVEAQVVEALGADEDFRVGDRNGPVKLSDQDAAKWTFNAGDTVAIIGGRSRNSRLIDLTDDKATAYYVRRDLREFGRDEALDTLRDWGYDVGDSGYNGERIKPDRPIEGDAERIKKEIDRGEVDPTYDRVFRVSCRLFRIQGWDAAWKWLARTFGEEFDSRKTHEHLKTIVEFYDDYDHVTVPDDPSEQRVKPDPKT